MIYLDVESNWAYFRPPTSRNMRDTYFVIPPATAFGFIKSMLGKVENDQAVLESEIQIIQNKNIKQESFVTSRRIIRGKGGDSKLVDSNGWRILTPVENPIEPQEYLVDYKFTLGIKGSKLEREIKSAFNNKFSNIERFGCLSLGESTCLVNKVSLRENIDAESFKVLERGMKGSIYLPLIQCYNYSEGETIWARCSWKDYTINSTTFFSWGKK